VNPNEPSKIQLKTAGWKSVVCEGKGVDENVMLGVDANEECWWDVDGAFLTCPYKGMVLDASGGANEGTFFKIHPKNKTVAQKWKIEEVTVLPFAHLRVVSILPPPPLRGRTLIKVGGLVGRCDPS
jgi:hypothetical protein